MFSGKCPKCGANLVRDRETYGLVRCFCGWSGDENEVVWSRQRAPGELLIKSAIAAVLLVAFLIIGTSIFLYRSWGKFFIEANVIVVKIGFDTASEQEIRRLGAICNTLEKDDCSIRSYTALLKKHPDNDIYLANLAMAQTRSDQHKEAYKNYENYFNLGNGTPDVMFSYAETLIELDRIEEAIEWLYNVLSIDVVYVDVTKKLLSILVKQGRLVEALSVIESAVRVYPQQDRYWKGQATAIARLLEKERVYSGSSDDLSFSIPMIVPGVRYVPVKIGDDRYFRPFIVDTGASAVVVSYEILDAIGVRVPKNAKKIDIQLAQGRSTAKEMFIKRLSVGPVVLENVMSLVCEDCQLLLGNSALSHFDITTKQVRGVEFMTFRQRHK